MLCARKCRLLSARYALPVLLAAANAALAAAGALRAPALQDPVPALTGGVWSFSDLDGDLRPDRVRYVSTGSDLQGYSYTVQFEMSAGRTSAPIAIHAEDGWGLRIVPRDVDGDHDLDLVVTSGPHQHPVDIWINDGRGSFSPAGPMGFASAIWIPGQSFDVPAPAVPGQDAIAAQDSGFIAVLTRAGAAGPADAPSQLAPKHEFFASPSNSLSCSRPRAPPAV